MPKGCREQLINDKKFQCPKITFDREVLYIDTAMSSLKTDMTVESGEAH